MSRKPRKKSSNRRSNSQSNNVVHQNNHIDVKSEGEDPGQMSLFGTQSIYSGPIPPASELGKYDQVHPGAAKIIIEMAQLEQKHRHKLDEVDLKGAISLTKAGQRYGFLLALFGIVIGAVLIYLDKNIMPFVGLLGALATLIMAAIYGRRKMAQADRENNEKEVDN